MATAGFAFWAFSGRQDYKNNVDAKISAAVASAKADQKTADDKRFTQEEKYPLKTYVGPSTFGSVQFAYSKKWSGYVDDRGTGNFPLDGFFHPNIVPPANETKSVFALRVQVLNQSYDTSTKEFTDKVISGKLTAKPFAAAKVPNVVGLRFDGALTETKTGSVILLPLRDKTLKISTESKDFQADFDNIILPSLTFSP